MVAGRTHKIQGRRHRKDIKARTDIVYAYRIYFVKDKGLLILSCDAMLYICKVCKER